MYIYISYLTTAIYYLLIMGVVVTVFGVSLDRHNKNKLERERRAAQAAAEAQDQPKEQLGEESVDLPAEEGSFKPLYAFLCF